MEAGGETDSGKDGGSRPSVTEQKMLQEVQAVREELNWLKAGAVPGVGVPVASLPVFNTSTPSQWQPPFQAYPSFASGPPPPATHGRGAWLQPDGPDQRG